MFEARLGPILVKKVLNLFAIYFVSVMVTPASLNKLGNALFDLFLDKISFIVFHVFFISFLKFVKQDSKYVFLAYRMLRLSIVLYILRLYLSTLYSGESGLVNFKCLYSLSRYLIYLKIPWVIQEDKLCFCLLNFITLLVMNLFLALVISHSIML